MLTRLREVAKILCFMALAVLLGFAARAMRDFDALLSDSRGAVAEIRATAGNASQSFAEFGTLAAVATQTAEQLNRTEAQQADYWAKTSAEMYKTTAALRLVIVRTDHTLNDQLAPGLTGAVADADGMIRDTSRNVSQTAASMQSALLTLNAAGDAAARQMADPHIADTIAHTDDAASQLAGMSAHMNQTAANVQETSALLEAKVRDLTKPASLALRIGKALLSTAGTAGQIAAGFFK